ncbi:MAG: hypothetical protein K6E10_11180 [Eubacterium sp.]|nr:hypothetical protein [Eubacterium sp.]
MNKEEWKAMSSKERVLYLLSYYFWVPLVMIGVIILIVFMVRGSKNNKEEINSGTTVNIGISEEGRKYLTEDYVLSKGQKLETAEASLATEFLTDPSRPDNTDDGSERMALVSHLQAGLYSYMIMDQYSYEEMQSTGIYGDLEKLMDSQMLEKYKADLVDTSYEDNGKSITYKGGLKLSNTSFYKAYHMNDMEMYFVIIEMNGEHEAGQDMLEYILSK